MAEFYIHWNEDGSGTVLGRVAARNGSGTSIEGEGKALQQANVTSIEYKLFDLDSDTPTVAVQSGTLTVANVIIDTLTDDDIWEEDATGYNFLHDVTASWFPDGGHNYVMEYKFTVSGGAVFHGAYIGPARPIRSS